MGFRQISFYFPEQVPANKFLFAEIVPANKFLFAGGVPWHKSHVIFNTFLFRAQFNKKWNIPLHPLTTLGPKNVYSA